MRLWRDMFWARHLSFLSTLKLLLLVKAVGGNLTGEIFQSENTRLTRRVNIFMATVQILVMTRATEVCKTWKMNGKM